MDRDPKTVLDPEVRRHIYDHMMQTGVPPTAADTAMALSAPVADVQASLQRLAGAHMLVLQKGRQEVLMAARLAFAARGNSIPRAMLGVGEGVVRSGPAGAGLAEKEDGGNKPLEERDKYATIVSPG